MILGINRTADGSICLLSGDTVVACLAKERLTRRKHDWGAPGDIARVYAPAMPILRSLPIDAVVECFSTQQPTEGQLGEYEGELRATLNLKPGAPIIRMSHHLAHMYSVFDASPFDEAAVMVIDAQGSHAADFTEPWPPEAPASREVMSFYVCGPDGRRCIGKQLWDGELAHATGLGMFYYLFTQMLFPGDGNEGKVMGLASYGSPSPLSTKRLRVDPLAVHFGDWASLVEDHLRPPVRYTENFSAAVALAAEGQYAFEEALLEVARQLHAATGAESLCFAGGTALNCAANGRLVTETPFRHVFVPPAPHDAGTALGCALYGFERVTGRRCGFRWIDDYLGPADEARRAPDLQSLPAGYQAERVTSMVDSLVDALVAGHAVGVLSGRAEFGPRALGHRSILADPRTAAMRDRINSQIKGREWFRPLAPVVPLERARDYFVLPAPSPFMQFTAVVKPECRELLGAITHVDGTARLQTVTRADNPDLHTLITRFGERTGVYVLLNTSFNGQDEPIVESYADALRCLSSTDMDILALADHFIIKDGRRASCESPRWSRQSSSYE